MEVSGGGNCSYHQPSLRPARTAAACDLSWVPCLPLGQQNIWQIRLQDPSYDKRSRQHRHPQAGRVRGSLVHNLQGRIRIWITEATQALGRTPCYIREASGPWGSGSSVGVLYTGMCRHSSRERCLLEVQHHPECITTDHGRVALHNCHFLLL